MGYRAPVGLIRQHQQAERTEFVALLLDLDPDDWQRPTPCTDWTVGDIAAHVLGWEQLLAGATRRTRLHRTLRLLVVATTSRFNIDRVNARLRSRTPDVPAQILAALTNPDVSRWKWRFDRLSPAAQLAEYVIHHEDVRAATRRPRVIPQERLDIALHGVHRLPGMSARNSTQRPELTGREQLLHLAGR